MATIFNTPAGELKVEHLAHFSLFLEWDGKKIYVDPYSDLYDFSKSPKADLILLTHAHTDHYDCKAIEQIATEQTKFIVSKSVKECLCNNHYNADPSTNLQNMYQVVEFTKKCSVEPLENGQTTNYFNINIRATAAYNIKNFRDNGNPFHIKGEGNGYLLTLGGYRVFIAGDTELIPELEEFKGVDILFLPKNMPYTLSDEKFIEAANLLKPKALFAVHYFEVDPEMLREAITKETNLYIGGRLYQ